MIQASEWIVVGLLRASAGLSIAALAVAACVRLLRLRAPKAEQWAWTIVLAQGVILFPVAIPFPSGIWGPGTTPRLEQTIVPSSESPHLLKEVDRVMAGQDVSIEPAALPVPVVESLPGPAATARRPWDDVKLAWPFVVLTAWLAGIGALLVMGFLRYQSFAVRLREARLADPEWQAQWRQVLDEQAIRATIPLLVSPETGPALVWTWAGNRLVVPRLFWAGLSTSERSAILRHELEHYRRGDLWAALLARGLTVLHWFNPLAWWAVARFEAQSEFICDRASAVDDPSAFAAMLLRLGSSRRERVAIVQSAGSGSLFERIQRLLADAPQPARWKCAVPVAVSVVALGIMAVRLQAVGASDGTTEPSSGPAVATGTQPPLPLPPRGLLRIGTDDLRTPGVIRSFAFSPGGRLVAAGDLNAPNPRISIFDVRTGRRVQQLVAPGNEEGWVEAVAFSPDGTKLLWGEMRGGVALWDLSTNRLLFRQKLYQSNVMDVEFSPDGRWFASGSDRVIRLRKVEKPEEVVRDFTMQTIGHLAFTPDGTRLVAGGQFSTMISVWRVSDGQLLRQIGPTAGDHLKSMVVMPDSRHILSAGYREEGEGAEERRKIMRLKDPRDVLHAMDALSAAGPKQPTVKRTEIWLWDIETGERVRDLNRPEEVGFGDVALSPDGRRMAIVNFRGLRMLDAETGGPQWTTDLPGWWGRPPAFSSDGRLVGLPDQDTVAIYEVSTGRRLHHDESTPVGRVVSAAWSPSGDRIVTGHVDGFVRVWDAATGKRIWHKLLAPIISHGGRGADPTFVDFSRDGKHVVAAGHRDDPAKSNKGIVAVYEAASGQTVREVPQKEFLRTALAPDGRFVVVAWSNLFGIEVATGRTRWSNRTVSQPRRLLEVAALQFESNPPWFEAALKGGDVVRFNALTGHEQRRFLADNRTPEQQKAGQPKNSDIFTATFSADGRTMASSSEGWVCVWDVQAGTLQRRIRYPHAHGCFLALAPDGKTVATSDVPPRSHEGHFGEDKVRLYDVETGEPVLTLEPVDDRATVLAFSPDGTRLLTGFERGSVIVWDVRRGHGASKANE